MSGTFASLVRVFGAVGLCVAATAAQASGDGTSPCGPMPFVAPSTPLTEFAGGHLGVLDATFQRAYQVAAWRVLDDRPLSAKEAQLLSRVLREASSYAVPAKDWEKALHELGAYEGKPLPIPQSRWSFNDKTGDSSLDLSSYANCTGEATRIAAETLRQRATLYGDASKNPWVAQWVAGQQQVFSNCGKGFELPEEAAPNAPQWFKQDRAYQRAAARFYAGRFTEASEDFDFIAKDKSSPWAELAPYLAGRAMLRRASLSKDPGDGDIRIAAARVRFEQLARDGTPRQRHLAEAMLRRIRASRQPTGLLADSARKVGEQAWDDDTEQALGDFLTLMRGAVERRDNALRSNRTTEQWARADAGIADWMADMNLLEHIAPAGQAFEGRDISAGDAKTSAAIAPKACRLALGTEHTKAWLLTCVAAASSAGDVPPKVLAQALALKSGDPAYPTVRYHLLRLAVDAVYKGDLTGVGQLTGSVPKDVQEAAGIVRKDLERSISAGAKPWAPEGVNALSILRARLATNVGEVLQYSRLQSLDDAPQYAWHQEVARPVEPNAKELYPYANTLLAQGLDTQSLAAASQDQAVSTSERKYLRRLAWVRAAALDQQELLQRLTPAVVADYPEHKEALEAVRGAANSRARRLELARLLLADTRFTVLYAESDVARAYDNEAGWHDLKPVAAPLGLLSPAQQSAAAEELRRLQQLQDSTSFIGNALIAWSQDNPRDERLAPALAQLVKATRNNYAIADKTVSRRAFQTLHRLFPTSSAAKETKYYY